MHLSQASDRGGFLKGEAEGTGGRLGGSYVLGIRAGIGGGWR
jgi:hypothetical protein